MMCPRCVQAVREVLRRLGYPIRRVELGLVELGVERTAVDWAQLVQALAADGFELWHLPRQRLVDQITAAVEELLTTNPEGLHGRFAAMLSAKMQRNYSSLSHAFSAEEGVSLEQYVIQRRVATVARLLKTSTLSVGRIARQLGYSSHGHLSRQFRQVLGVAPTEYRQQMSEVPANFASDAAELCPTTPAAEGK
ncbi:helix-turn-helix transcriptional regulator [Hymenobacter jeollabukensis]|nr:AraC family transcriptional regulator [Hymenobacter jeollabukensis]